MPPGRSSASSSSHPVVRQKCSKSLTAPGSVASTSRTPPAGTDRNARRAFSTGSGHSSPVASSVASGAVAAASLASAIGAPSAFVARRRIVGCGGAFAGVERERDAVHAIALAGRLRPIVEDMAEMPAATPAVHFGARHEERAVAFGFDRILERRPKAWPAGAAVELRVGREERLAAAGAMIDAGAVFLVERARPGALGAVLAQYLVLFGGQPPAPLLIAQRDLESLFRFGVARLAAAAETPEETLCHVSPRQQ